MPQVDYRREWYILSRVDGLCTTQEEADTHTLLHASHALSGGYDCIIIKSPDTDLAVLVCTCSHQTSSRILLSTGTKERQRYIDITAIGQSLGDDVCLALPVMHVFTGCDSTSAFVGKGKKQALQFVESDPDLCTVTKIVGDSFCNSDVHLQGCAHFVCELYGYNGCDTGNVRYKLFGSRNAQSYHLPPTKDALKHHVARANYQVLMAMTGM